ncbi:PSP1 C-terminal conserved region [Fusobacterium necrogenes]|uniref:PSP1 C-terminal conserved region n=2 Tax=Fusobacterium necrogenes TaxID=858 RepID=A0A377GVX7_9FUSO|nr:PSP1 C-terminal conserved region [Fusobacterium necrogenes]
MEDINKEEIDGAQVPKLYKVLGVMFEVTKKRYYFEVIDNVEYKKGDKVIVDTVRGKEIGVVYGEARMIPEAELVLPLKPVLKKASREEEQRYSQIKIDSLEAKNICKERISYHKLPMKLVETEYTFDKTKLIFYFTAEGRIDFRDLVKDLANIFRVRIELRQIGVRDEARILGTVGLCGKELCCRTFINKFDSVSIKMARDQGLVINPAKISGVCGRLLCCINYEYYQYEEALRNYPAVNQQVRTPKGDGKVSSISPLNGYLFVDVENKGLMKFNVEEVRFNKKEANKLKNEKTAEELAHKELEKE